MNDSLGLHLFLGITFLENHPAFLRILICGIIALEVTVREVFLAQCPEVITGKSSRFFLWHESALRYFHSLGMLFKEYHLRFFRKQDNIA